MGKKKLERFEENKKSKFIIQEGKGLYNNTKGKWNKIFKNNNLINLEIGCGYGEYTFNLARKYRKKNFIGIDIKGSRIWKGSKIAEDENLKNVMFLRIRIEEIIDFFSKNEVYSIYIIFPDPRPKKRDLKKRLVGLDFMKKYFKILKNNGKVILKTDDIKLFELCISTLKNNFRYKNLLLSKDYYKSSLYSEEKNIKTRYEEKFLKMNKKINYLEFNKAN
tara:strand:+ start:165 stop:824 length:660 start_codon:yes stop_codon:yes gene_type:complete